MHSNGVYWCLSAYRAPKMYFTSLLGKHPQENDPLTFFNETPSCGPLNFCRNTQPLCHETLYTAPPAPKFGMKMVRLNVIYSLF